MLLAFLQPLGSDCLLLSLETHSVRRELRERRLQVALVRAAALCLAREATYELSMRLHLLPAGNFELCVVDK